MNFSFKPEILQPDFSHCTSKLPCGYFKVRNYIRGNVVLTLITVVVGHWMAVVYQSTIQLHSERWRINSFEGSK